MNNRKDNNKMIYEYINNNYLFVLIFNKSILN